MVRAPDAARASIVRALARLREGAQGRAWLRRLALSSSARLVDHACQLPLGSRDALLTDEARAACAEEPDPFEERVRRVEECPFDPSTALRRLHLQEHLPYAVLAPIDRLASRLGLTPRLPLLDAAIVDTACALGLDAAAGRRVIDHIADELIPPGMGGRARTAAGVPLDAWLRGPWRDPARAVLLDPSTRLRGLLDPRAVATLLDEHLDARRDRGAGLWALCALELWAHRAFERGSRTAPPLEVLRA